MIESIVNITAFILLALLLRAVFSRFISAKARYMIWILVMIRLAIPFSVAENPLNIVGLVSFLPTAVEYGAIENAGMINDGAADEGQSLNAGIGAKQTDPIRPDTPRIQRFFPSTASVLVFIWIFGSIMSASWFLLVAVRTKARLLRSSQLIDRTECGIPVYSTSFLSSPCLFGVFKPAIHLTQEVAENPRYMRYAIEHELCHYAHKDHLWSALRVLLLVMYWFHPLVWLCSFLSIRDSELACDELVINRIGEDRRFDYGRSLIELSIKTPRRSLTVLQSQNFGGNLKKRVVAVSEKPKTKILAVVALAIFLTLSSACTFGTWVLSQNAQMAHVDGLSSTADVRSPSKDIAGSPEDLKGVGFNLDQDGTMDDMVYVVEHSTETPDEKKTVTIKMGNGNVFEREYPGYWNVSISCEDLLGDGTNCLIIWTQNKTSNYGASNVYVLRTDGQTLDDVFTVLDCYNDLPGGVPKEYINSLFIVPEPADHFGYTDNPNGNDSVFCSGVELMTMEIDGQSSRALKIQHYVLGRMGYSIVYFDGTAWVVYKQGRD